MRIQMIFFPLFFLFFLRCESSNVKQAWIHGQSPWTEGFETNWTKRKMIHFNHKPMMMMVLKYQKHYKLHSTQPPNVFFNFVVEFFGSPPFSIYLVLCFCSFQHFSAVNYLFFNLLLEFIFFAFNFYFRQILKHAIRFFWVGLWNMLLDF